MKYRYLSTPGLPENLKLMKGRENQIHHSETGHVENLKNIRKKLD